MKKLFIILVITGFLIRGEEARAQAQASTTQVTAVTIALQGVGVLTAPAWLVPAILTTAGITVVAATVYTVCPGQNLQEKSAFLHQQTAFLMSQGVRVLACANPQQRFLSQGDDEIIPTVEEDGTLVLGDGVVRIGPKSVISVDPRRLKINGKKVNPASWEEAMRKREEIIRREDSSRFEGDLPSRFSSPSQTFPLPKSWVTTPSFALPRVMHLEPLDADEHAVVRALRPFAESGELKKALANNKSAYLKIIRVISELPRAKQKELAYMILDEGSYRLNDKEEPVQNSKTDQNSEVYQWIQDEIDWMIVSFDRIAPYLGLQY